MLLFIYLLVSVGVGRADARALSSFTADQAIDLAGRRPTLEFFLHGLPYELRDAYVMSYRPRGNQRGTPLFPRTFAFGQNLIVAFSGCPGSRGHDAIEMMDLRGDAPELIELKFADRLVTVRHRPRECVECHGIHSRPLWPSTVQSPRWVGFYGTGTAQLTGEREDQLFQKFFALNRDHPRYSGLANLDRVAPYSRGRAEVKSLYDANFRFEATIARAVARQTFAYLTKHRSFDRAKLPLLLALSLAYRDHVGIEAIDVAAELAPLVRMPVEQIRSGLARHLAVVTRSIEEQTKSNQRFLKSSLEWPDLNVASLNADRTDEIHFRLAATLSYLAELYGLSELETKMSTSRKPGAFAYPGRIAPLSMTAALERMLYLHVLRQSGLTDQKVGRIARTWSPSIHNIAYTSWASPADMRVGLARIASALGREVSCEGLFL